MPQLAPIVLQDGASTPVSRTFSPKGIADGILASLEEAVGAPVTRPKFDISVRKPVNKAGMYRVKMTISVPAPQTVDGIVGAHHTNVAHIELLVHESSTDAEINNLYAFCKNVWGNALVSEAVKTLTPFY